MNTEKVIDLLRQGTEKNIAISAELKEANQKTLTEKEQLEKELSATTFADSVQSQVA